MKRHIYTEEQERWILEHAENSNAEQLKDAFNKKFNATVTYNGIIQKRQRMGIDKGKPQRIYTQEEENFLRVNRNKMPMKDLHRKFCETFSEIGFYAWRVCNGKS